MALGVGVIGCGAIAINAHIPIYQYLPETKVIAVADIIPSQLKLVQKQFQIKHGYLDYHKLLAREDIEVVSICLPAALHKDAVLAALKAKKHILCEKPLATTLKDGQMIVEAVEKSKSKFMVGFNYRFNFGSLIAKRFIDLGTIGRIIQISAKFCVDIGSGTSVTNYQFDRSAGGGALFDSGTHLVDLVEWIGGGIQAVHANIHKKYPQTDADEKTTVILKMDQEYEAQILINWGTEKTQAPVVIKGTHGKIEIDLFKANLFRIKSRHLMISHGFTRTFFQQPQPGQKLHTPEIAHFVDCVLKDKPPQVTANQALKNLQVIIAAYKSAQTGKLIKIPKK